MLQHIRHLCGTRGPSQRPARTAGFSCTVWWSPPSSAHSTAVNIALGSSCGAKGEERGGEGISAQGVLGCESFVLSAPVKSIRSQMEPAGGAAAAPGKSHPAGREEKGRPGRHVTGTRKCPQEGGVATSGASGVGAGRAGAGAAPAPAASRYERDAASRR